MGDMSDQGKNLAGCTLMGSVVAVFLVLCLYIGLSSRPQEILASDVSSAPAGGR